MADPVTLISGAALVGTLVKVFVPGDNQGNLDIHPSYLDKARAIIGDMNHYTGLKSIHNGREERRYQHALEEETHRVLVDEIERVEKLQEESRTRYQEWLDEQDRGYRSPEQRS